jgi:hypothetical protein
MRPRVRRVVGKAPGERGRAPLVILRFSIANSVPQSRSFESFFEPGNLDAVAESPRDPVEFCRAPAGMPNTHVGVVGRVIPGTGGSRR